MTKIFTHTRRVNDIIAMGVIYNTFFSIEEIIRDYDISEDTAYRTIREIRRVEFVKVFLDKDSKKYIIELLPKLLEKDKEGIITKLKI